MLYLRKLEERRLFKGDSSVFLLFPPKHVFFLFPLLLQSVSHRFSSPLHFLWKHSIEINITQDKSWTLCIEGQGIVGKESHQWTVWLASSYAQTKCTRTYLFINFLYSKCCWLFIQCWSFSYGYSRWWIWSEIRTKTQTRSGQRLPQKYGKSIFSLFFTSYPSYLIKILPIINRHQNVKKIVGLMQNVNKKQKKNIGRNYEKMAAKRRKTRPM